MSDYTNEKSGQNSLLPETKPKKKKWLWLVLVLVGVIVCVAVVAGFAIFPENKVSGDYEKQIELGYKYIGEGNYEEAIIAFDKAIEIDEKKSKAYYGKAEAMAHDPEMTVEKAEAIILVLEDGYKKSGDEGLMEYKKNVAELIEANGFADAGKVIMEDHSNGGADENKDIKTLSVNPDEMTDTLYSDFESAYDFWINWIYGQTYVTDVQETDGVVIRGVVSHPNITSVEKLEEVIGRHFTDTMTEMYIDKLEPEEKNGKLYINTTRGIGDNGIEIVGHDIEKISENKYILTLDTMPTLGVVDEAEMDKYKVLCSVKEDKWVFANYFNDAEKIIKGSWNIVTLNQDKVLEFEEDRKVVLNDLNTNKKRTGTYEIVDDSLVRIVYDDTSEVKVIQIFSSSVLVEHMGFEDGVDGIYESWERQDVIYDDGLALFS